MPDTVRSSLTGSAQVLVIWWRWPALSLGVVAVAYAVFQLAGPRYSTTAHFERLLALIGAAWLAAVAVAVLRRNPETTRTFAAAAGDVTGSVRSGT